MERNSALGPHWTTGRGTESLILGISPLFWCEPVISSRFDGERALNRDEF